MDFSTIICSKVIFSLLKTYFPIFRNLYILEILLNNFQAKLIADYKVSLLSWSCLVTKICFAGDGFFSLKKI